MATASIVLRKMPDKENKLPVVLRLSHKKKDSILSFNVHVYAGDWDDKAMQIKKSCRYVDNRVMFNNAMLQKLSELRRLIQKLDESGDLPRMTAPQIMARFKNNAGIVKTTVQKYILFIAAGFTTQGRHSNAHVYAQVARWLDRYAGTVQFTDITVSWLSRVSNAWYAKGHGSNGLSFYLRTLRAVYNHAIKHGVVSRDAYPFDRFSMPQGNTAKQFLTSPEIAAILRLDLPVYSRQWHCRNYWMFMYYCNGMSIADMARLTPDNIRGSHIIYVRHKTSRKKSETPVVVTVIPPVRVILDTYIKRMAQDYPYIFPFILRPGQPEKHYSEIRSAAKVIDKHMRRVARLTGSNIQVTCGMARHSWANAARSVTPDKKLIQQALGHSSIKTTEIYMGSFGSNEIDSLTFAVYGNGNETT